MEDDDEDTGINIAECIVCLQAFAQVQHIPRVLACGHSLCQSCVFTLASDKTLDSCLRCPECNHLTKLPVKGPGGLPKNIELLRFLDARTGHGKPQQQQQVQQEQQKGFERENVSSSTAPCPIPDSIPELRKWIIAQNAVTCSEDLLQSGHHQIFLGEVVLFGDSKIRRAYPATFLPLELIANTSIPKGMKHLNYEQRVLYLLKFLPGNLTTELLLLFRLSGLCRRVSTIFGLWMNLNGILYLACRVYYTSGFCHVWQGLKGTVDPVAKQGESVSEFNFIFSESSVNAAIEICELFVELHSEGFVAALLNPQCLVFDRFGHAILDLNAALKQRKDLQNYIGAQMTVMSTEINSSLADTHTSQLVEFSLWHYASPELLSKFCGIDGEKDSNIACKTDIWTLGCLLFSLFCGRTPWSNLTFHDFFQKFVMVNQTAVVWLEERINLTSFGTESMGPALKDFSKVLVKCFEYEWENRPEPVQLWHALKSLTFWFHDEKDQTLSEKRIAASIEETTLRENRLATCIEDQHAVYWCIALGCPSHEIQSYSTDEGTSLSSNCGPVQRSLESKEESKFPGHLEETSCLDGHFDSVTALILCGVYLLSASFDKSICVWSLQDDTLVQRLKGHSQKVMALAVEQQSHLCCSGDYGGEICVWSVGTGTDYIAKWYDHQDWRYTGVASLAVSTDGFLYSGSGDRTIKAWSLQDYSLVATMEGHKGLVSALLIDGEVLYSGSWDGTIQLWLRDDHSSLMVLSPCMGPVRAISKFSGLLIAGYDSGCLQVWKDGCCLKSTQAHDGVISAFCLDGSILFTGSWDCTIKAWQLEELQDDMSTWLVDACGSAITSLEFHEGKLYAGLAEKVIKIRRT